MKVIATLAALALSLAASASFAQEYTSTQQDEVTTADMSTQMSSDLSFRPPEHRPPPGHRPPFHHPPERRPDHNRWGHGGFDHHPGFNSPGWDRREGWAGHYRWEPGHFPGWWGLWAIPAFIVLEETYAGQGVWECTAIGADRTAHAAAAPGRFAKEQAVYNAMYDCGGLPIGGAPQYCYVPADYCRYY